jgi:arsenate reductase
MITLYHNPRCSKSRQALAMCEASSMNVQVHLYLNNPLSSTEIRSVLSRLQGPLNNAIRLKDPKFKSVDSSSLEPSKIDSVVAFLTEHGHLMERPLLDTGLISCVGRPVELLLPLL